MHILENWNLDLNHFTAGVVLMPGDGFGATLSLVSKTPGHKSPFYKCVYTVSTLLKDIYKYH